MKIDLHNHSTFSDGCLSPHELIDWSIERNLKAVAITDHNSIDGIEMAIRYAENKNIDFVPGVEFSVKESYCDKEIHIIGLFIDHKNKYINNLIAKYKNFRSIEAINNRHCERLENVINAIHNSGGVSILAHPEFISPWENKVIERFNLLGGDGLEVNYNYGYKFKKREIQKLDTKYRKIAKRDNFIVSGGGDFHIRKDLRPIGEYGLTEGEFEIMKKYVVNSRL